MKKVKIAPSILGTKEEDLVSSCSMLIESGCDYIHFDVMDGIFVENKSFSPSSQKIIKDALPTCFIDTHLMIVNVPSLVDEYIDNGASLITFHYEAVKEEDILPLIKHIKEKGCKVGISIKPNTKKEVLDPYLEELDLILVMSVEPGKGGQSFMENSLPKIKYYSDKKNEKTHYEIEVDGGINDKTAALCKEAGVDVLVAGSYIMKASSFKERIDSLK